ncbi:sensor histidine kinase [Novispirillum itersonii]|uniref:sensor histidine kinase n=1 Tax=Novispirillum itersonii TaxID=189 RepID=UPI0012DCDA10|nr:HAMP domain-containing sensor histidine kinase [Novispirillum itersonii]
MDALPEDVLIVLAVIIGTAAGAAFSAHASRQVAAIQMISLLGVMLAGLDQPFLRHYLAPVLVFTVPFCLFLLYYTFRFNTLMKQRLTLQLRNAALLADLTAEQSRLQQEIAERQRNAEALQAAHDASLRAAAAKDRFLSSVSHELRTPLNAVIGFVDLVVDIWPDPLTDRQSRALESVRQSGRHLHALVTDILDYSSCLQGDMPVNCQPVLLQDVLPDCLTALQPQAQRAAIQLPDGDGFYPGRVLADPRRLRQILFNLLGNAVKYNREGGVVMLRIAPDGDMIRIEIEDSGVGIPPMQRDRLFEAFNRLGREASSIEGSGLGLALSRRLTELMGGTLDYVPADGGGSLFILALPSAA